MRLGLTSLLLVLLLSVNAIRATSANPQASTPRQSSVSTDQPDANTSSAELDSLIREGNVAVYNLEYEKASKIFQQMIAKAPAHPAGYVCLASNLWLETLNRNRRLSSSLYSSASFYAQGVNMESFDSSEDYYKILGVSEGATREDIDRSFRSKAHLRKPRRGDHKKESEKHNEAFVVLSNPETRRAYDRDREFSRLVKKAVVVAQARLKNDPYDVSALYYKGVVLGIRAAYKVTVRRSFWDAIGDAKSSVLAQNKVIKLDPDYLDAKLSIGFYEYVVDSLPLWWRMVAKFVGINGSKKRGIELLEAVAERGRYASDDARVLLIGIHTREHNYEQALALVGYLAGKYSRNYLLGIERAALLYRLSRVDEGARAFADLLKDEQIAASATDVVNYQYGEALTEAGNYASALERYKAVVDWPDSHKSLVILAHLRAGGTLDALGRHREAKKEYEIVLREENVYDSHDLAKKYLEKPYVPDRK